MSEYVVLYERTEDGDWGAYLPDLPGVVALGQSRAEVEERIREAVEAALAFDREHGRALPPPMHEAASVNVESGAVSA